MVSKKERLQNIKELLYKTGSVSSRELAKLLQVSDVTIRKDLEVLAKDPEIERTFGGASLKNDEKHIFNADTANFSKSEEYQENLSIAKKALEFIEPNDTVFLGSGITCCILASLLPKDIKLSIITNNISAINDLINKNCKIFLVGGEVETTNNKTYFSSIPNPAQYLESICITKAFTSCYGIDINAGITVNSIISSYVFKDLPKIQKNWHMMVSHNKFQRIGMYKAGQINAIQNIIYTSMPEDFNNYCITHNIKLAKA